MSEFEKFIGQATALNRARGISARAAGDGVPTTEVHKSPEGVVKFGPDGKGEVSNKAISPSQSKNPNTFWKIVEDNI